MLASPSSVTSMPPPVVDFDNDISDEEDQPLNEENYGVFYH